MHHRNPEQTPMLELLVCNRDQSTLAVAFSDGELTAPLELIAKTVKS
jgi:hypothetical protein